LFSQSFSFFFSVYLPNSLDLSLFILLSTANLAEIFEEEKKNLHLTFAAPEKEKKEGKDDAPSTYLTPSRYLSAVTKGDEGEAPMRLEDASAAKAERREGKASMRRERKEI